MRGKFEGKVAFITGAARGQGRSHAIRMAEEGADIVAFDLCEQIDTVQHTMGTSEDLAQTVKEVESLDRRIVAIQGDVRDLGALESAVARAVSELGGIDFLVANAGIMPTTGDKGRQIQAWRDAIDVMATGVFFTLHAAVPTMIEQGRGGSIVITSSTSGLRGVTHDPSMLIPGQLGYGAAKHAVVGLMRNYAMALGKHKIRVNTVHPMGVNTPMVVNDFFGDVIKSAPPGWMANVLSQGLIEPVDVSNAIVWLCSDEARYVTGTTLPVDSGQLVL